MREIGARSHCSRVSHNSDVQTASLEATLLYAWHYEVSARTGWLGVCML